MAEAAEPLVTRLRIEAPPEIVFDGFCDPNALISWMGDRAELEPSPDGNFEVDIHGYAVRGRYQVLERPCRLVFSWGYEGPWATEPPPAV